MRKRLTPYAALLLAAALSPATSHAQDYPSQTIRMVIALPPGGSADTIGRMFAEHLRANLKQNVIVENKPGGDGLIGPVAVAKAKADGYTLLFSTPSLPTVKAFIKAPQLDPEKDLVAVGQVVESPFVIAVSLAHDVKTVGQFLEQAKTSGKSLNIGYFAAGHRLTTEQFRLSPNAKGVQLTAVGYKGEAAMLAALAGGEVDIGIATAVTIKGLAAQGKVRALAVTGAHRSISLPDLPTAEASGAPGFRPSQIWFGLLAPAGTPEPIIKTLSEQVFSFAKVPGIGERLAPFGFAALPNTPQAFARMISEEAARAVELGRVAGIEPQ